MSCPNSPNKVHQFAGGECIWCGASFTVTPFQEERRAGEALPWPVVVDKLKLEDWRKAEVRRAFEDGGLPAVIRYVNVLILFGYKQRDEDAIDAAQEILTWVAKRLEMKGVNV